MAMNASQIWRGRGRGRVRDRVRGETMRWVWGREEIGREKGQEWRDGGGKGDRWERKEGEKEDVGPRPELSDKQSAISPPTVLVLD